MTKDLPNGITGCQKGIGGDENGGYAACAGIFSDSGRDGPAYKKGISKQKFFAALRRRNAAHNGGVCVICNLWNYRRGDAVLSDGYVSGLL